MSANYIKYLYSWVKRYGFKFSPQPLHTSNEILESFSNEILEPFYNPISYYRMYTQNQYFIKAAKERKNRSVQAAHDRYIFKRKMYGEEVQLTIKSINERLYPKN